MSDEQQTETPLQQPLPPVAAKGKKIKAVILLTIILLVGGWFGISWYLKGKTHISTDNAFVESSIIPMSFKVPGTVNRVMVRDNQFVKKGELLAELDQRDFQLQVSKAEAGVGMAVNETGGEQQQVGGLQAGVQLAQARHEQALVDLNRGEALFGRDVIPKEQLERLKTAEKVAAAQLTEARESLKRARAIAGLASTIGSKARIKQRQAQLEEARQQLSYSRLYAPQDGYITRKSAEPGANIQPGQPLMALVPLQDAWIIANYKEAQIGLIRPGQKVEFTVDAYPGKKLTGTVDSIMAGTGAAFSLLPPENATGNYVKVVQRLPVKIAIDHNSDPEQLLRVGMSVIPTVLVGK